MLIKRGDFLQIIIQLKSGFGILNNSPDISDFLSLINIVQIGLECFPTLFFRLGQGPEARLFNNALENFSSYQILSCMHGQQQMVLLKSEPIGSTGLDE